MKRAVGALQTDLSGHSKLVGLCEIVSLSDYAEAPKQFVLAALGGPQRPERLHGGVQPREERRVDGGETPSAVVTAALPKLAIHLNRRIILLLIRHYLPLRF